MRLAIHGGLHKTATTSFQHFIHENQRNLSDFSIFYPNLGEATRHNQLIYFVLNDNWNYVNVFLNKSIHLARKIDAETVILSAEDFETVLCNPHTARKFFSAVYAAGFSEIQCYFILRRQWDYFNSLYAEKSKHNLCINYANMAEAIIKFGEISMQNSYTRWNFAFDYDRIISKFAESTQVSIRTFMYENFVNGQFIGDVLIKDLLGLIESKNFFESAKFSTQIFNERNSVEDVELNYIKNFFGQPSDEKAFDFFKKNLVPARLQHISTIQNVLRRRFEVRFPIVSTMSQNMTI